MAETIIHRAYVQKDEWEAFAAACSQTGDLTKVGFTLGVRRYISFFLYPSICNSLPRLRRGGRKHRINIEISRDLRDEMEATAEECGHTITAATSFALLLQARAVTERMMPRAVLTATEIDLLRSVKGSGVVIGRSSALRLLAAAGLVRVTDHVGDLATCELTGNGEKVARGIMKEVTVTRAQRRYQAFLKLKDFDSSLTFTAYLTEGRYKAHRAIAL